MKTWELIKALEDGYRIKTPCNRYYTNLNDLLFSFRAEIIDNPGAFEIIKPKKKIKFCAFHGKGTDELRYFIDPKETDIYKRLPEFDIEKEVEEK